MTTDQYADKWLKITNGRLLQIICNLKWYIALGTRSLP